MSHTVSSGVSRVSNWTVVAAIATDYLKKKASSPRVVPQGALFAIGKFFESALIVARTPIHYGDNCGEIKSLATISCHKIATGILLVLFGPENLTVPIVEEKLSKYLGMIQIVIKKGLKELKSQSDDVQELCRFLDEMEKQGNLDRSEIATQALW